MSIFTSLASRQSRASLLFALTLSLASSAVAAQASQATQPPDEVWIGTWATAPQSFMPGDLQTFHNQTLRLIVHTSAGGPKARIRISNLYGDQPLLIGAAHIARRISAADIDPASDRTLKFAGQPSVTIPAGSATISDPVALDVPPLSDLAISLYLPEPVKATTSHILAKQTSYVSPATGNACGVAKFPTGSKLESWPFLTGLDVTAASDAATIVALGSSLTDGDGSTADANMRWPNVLAERLQKQGGAFRNIGVLNEGIIGNRVLHDSPESSAPVGKALGQSGLNRFQRDVLDQPRVKYVIVALGINDIAMPGTITPASEIITADSMIAGYRQFIARAHEHGIRIIGSTNPPFEGAFLQGQPYHFYTPQKEVVRQKVNDWIRSSGEFDGVIDFDQAVRDPNHPTRILPAYDSGDHFHPNDAGIGASGNAVPLDLFDKSKLSVPRPR